MAASPEFFEHVSELLAPLGHVSGSRLFGGYGFKYHGIQFALIMGSTLYFCVDATTRTRYEALGMTPFSYTKQGRVVQVKKYYAVPEACLDQPDELRRWAREAIQTVK